MKSLVKLIAFCFCAALVVSCADDDSGGRDMGSGPFSPSGAGGGEFYSCNFSSLGMCIEIYHPGASAATGTCELGAASSTRCSVANTIGRCQSTYPAGGGAQAITYFYADSMMFSSAAEAQSMCVSNGGQFF